MMNTDGWSTLRWRSQERSARVLLDGTPWVLHLSTNDASLLLLSVLCASQDSAGATVTGSTHSSLRLTFKHCVWTTQVKHTHTTHTLPGADDANSLITGLVQRSSAERERQWEVKEG